MDNAGMQQLLSVVRSILIAIGAVVVSKGWASSDQVNEGIGLIIAVSPAIWGIIQKRQSERATKVRETAAVQAGITAVKVGAAPVTPGPIGPLHAAVIIKQFGPDKPK